MGLTLRCVNEDSTPLGGGLSSSVKVTDSRCAISRVTPCRRGYENWEDVAVSQTENGIKVIVANSTMMAAYSDGLPADGKLFPDGSKIAKIEWTSKRNAVSPYFVMVSDTLKSVSFIEKDTMRFPDTHGWAHAQFGYDATSDTFTPHGNDAKCGYECHSTVSAKDYIFTAYPKR
jgi:Cytochrome P460